MSLVYGYDVKGKDDVYLKTALDANDIAQRTFLPGAVLVNDLPFRESFISRMEDASLTKVFSVKHLPEWLPGMGFKALARLGDRLGKEMVNKPFAFVKDTMVCYSVSLPQKSVIFTTRAFSSTTALHAPP